MKISVRFVSLITCLLMIVSCFSACSGGISGDEAKTHINGFFAALEDRDYEKAEAFLHPAIPADLESFFKGLENDEGLNFSSIKIKRYTGFSSAYYDSSVDGSHYTLQMDVMVSDTEVVMEIQIVKNDKGYGIYNIRIDT